LKELGIPSQHFGHWGRVNAPADMEKAELPAEEIRLIGNWDPKTQEKRYSTKMPL